MSDGNHPIAFLEDLSIREVYAEIWQVLYGPAGLLRVELAVNRWSQTEPVHVDRIVPVARFAISLHTARGLRDQLTQCLDRLEKQRQAIQTPAESAAKN